MRQHGRVRGQAHKAHSNDPGNADAFRSVGQALPPVSGRGMQGRRFDMGEKQQIDVRNDHSRRSSRNSRCSSRKSSTSSWSLSWFSFMGSIPGRNPPRNGRTRNTGRSSGASGVRPRRRVSLTTADPNRALPDRYVLCDLLEFNEDVYQAVRRLAAKWCAEPSVHGGKQRPLGAELVI